MSRQELLSPEGLRLDGRRWNDLRNLSLSLTTHPTSSGSSLLSSGHTTILCNINGPTEPTLRSKQLHDRCTITVDLTYAPFSGTDRKRRNRTDKRISELRSVLQRTFSRAVMTHLHPRSEITITLLVLSQDGGVLAACVNAATLALIDAGVPMWGYVGAVTVGWVAGQGGEQEEETGTPVLDVNNAEEGDLPVLTMATMGDKGRVVMAQLESRVRLEAMEGLMAVAVDACGKVRELLDQEVRRHGAVLAKAAGVGS